MKNHFFVVLLAVIATATITETASAYYSTKLGRFVSRDPIGYVGSECNLYQYVQGHPTIDVDPSGWISNLEACYKGCEEQFKSSIFKRWACKQGCNWGTPPPEAPTQSQLCLNALSTAMNQMKDYIKVLENKGCWYTFSCENNCDTDCKDKDKKSAGYQNEQKVVVCYENHSGESSMIETWRHEITHRYDDCITGDDDTYVKGCQSLACTEIRSASLGECRDGGTGRVGGKSFQDCVTDAAITALKNRNERSCVLNQLEMEILVRLG